jgi:hypothetical protein
MFATSNFYAAVISGLSAASIATPTANKHDYAGAQDHNAAQQCYYPPNAQCTEYMIPISISSTNTVFNFTRWSDDYALEQFLADATTRPDVGFPSIVGGEKKVDADYAIAASFCTPKNASTPGKEDHVILATHGIGPGREHWNSAYKPETYNFVQHAIDEGYSVFFYDRLGCGLSSKQVHQHLRCLAVLTQK